MGNSNEKHGNKMPVPYERHENNNSVIYPQFDRQGLYQMPPRGPYQRYPAERMLSSQPHMQLYRPQWHPMNGSYHPPPVQMLQCQPKRWDDEEPILPDDPDSLQGESVYPAADRETRRSRRKPEDRTTGVGYVFARNTPSPEREDPRRRPPYVTGQPSVVGQFPLAQLTQSAGLPRQSRTQTMQPMMQPMQGRPDGSELTANNAHHPADQAFMGNMAKPIAHQRQVKISASNEQTDRWAPGKSSDQDKRRWDAYGNARIRNPKGSALPAQGPEEAPADPAMQLPQWHNMRQPRR